MPSIFFDLEGPLSPQDNAYEVLSLAKNGRQVFEVISRYDDVLTLEGRRGYEPGDTLKLIAPFLVYYGITEEDIRRVSKKARILKGAQEVISELKRSWKVYIISTSYQQHAYSIGKKLGVARKNIACTKMPLDRYSEKLKSWDFWTMKKAEKEIISLKNAGDKRIAKALDSFFFGTLQKTPMGRVFNEVKVIGGERKTRAMMDFIKKDSGKMSETAAVGDSITDYKMLGKVKESRGLAIVFNGNEYAVPHADVGIAAADQRFLLPVLSAFGIGGREAALAVARALESYSGTGANDASYSSLAGADKTKINKVIKIHKRFRMLVRGEAGKLG